MSDKRLEVVDGVAVIPHDAIASFRDRIVALAEEHDGHVLGRHLDDAATNITQLLAEYRGLKSQYEELRALLATPMPCGWPVPIPASPTRPTMVQWDAVDKYGDGGNALDADEAIALGVALVKAGMKAKGEE